MKNIGLCLLICLTVSFIGSSASYAQGMDPPPKCCPRSPGNLPGETQPALHAPTLIARFVVSQGILEAHRLTRRQFVDRLLQGLFPNENVDLLVFDKVSLDQPIPAASSPNFISGSRALVIQETRIFRIPVLDLTIEEFDRLDHIALTDGRVSIEIRFVAAGAIDAIPDGF